ncbi:MAG: hypothetical protein AAFY20_05060 [Cyanobacteria bacterium J06639_14]
MYSDTAFGQTRPTRSRKSEPLFAGIGLRWQTLTQSEKVVTLLITLTPLWWLMGWKHVFILIAMGVLAYDVRQYGNVRLKCPHLSVIALLVFCLYTLLSQYFYSAYQGDSLSPNAVLSPLNTYAGPAAILWYLQSHKIRIRWQVIAWSFTVVTLLMILFWGVIYFGWHQVHYEPPRSLYGALTGKSKTYVPGAGNSNYLIPYFPTDESFIPGFVRYVYFFSGPESLALVAGFISLLALEIKSKKWSILLFSTAVFILLTSGTRSVVMILPLILLIRGLFTTRTAFGPWFLCALLATGSFTTLSVPSITNSLLDTVTRTAEVAGEARADSTAVRGDIYQGTLDGLVQSSNRQFFWGYVTTGETVLPGYDPARIGSHSFWLGTLLYRSGVIGTLIFIVFWLSLIWHVYQHASAKPIVCRLIFIMLTLCLVVMEIEMPVMAIALLCVAIYKDRDK